MAGKPGLFVHSVLSPDPRSGKVEGLIAESLRPQLQKLPFCGDYRRRLVRSPLPPDHSTLPGPVLRLPTGRNWESVACTAARVRQSISWLALGRLGKSGSVA